MKKNKIKIVDLSTLIPGPFATFLLQKYIDAEVIKFEDLQRGDNLKLLRPTQDGIGLSYHSINKSKKIIQIDLRGNGLSIIKKELLTADIFVQNYKSGRGDKIGLGYEDVLSINPQILYCSISGYSENHPLVKKGAHDLNILGLSGYLDEQIRLTGTFSPPPIQLADILTSYSVCLQILSSLYKDEKGKYINYSMYDAVLEALTLYNFPILMSKNASVLEDSVMSGQYPCYRLYKSSDNKWVVVAVLEKTLWVDFCNILKRDDLIDKQFDSDTVKEVDKEMGKYKSNYWLNDEFDFCVTPVININEAKKLGYVK